MVPRETGNNAYAKFWRDKQRVFMVFLLLANRPLSMYQNSSWQRGLEDTNKETECACLFISFVCVL